VGKSENEVSPFGKRLREARTLKGISQKQLGILAGIDQFSASSRINQYERGKHTPDFLTAKQLARQLGVPVAFFYSGDDKSAEAILLFEKLSTKMKERVLQLMSNEEC
jgi:transcriptional regulator with XRE-family HTH domain